MKRYTLVVFTLLLVSLHSPTHAQWVQTSGLGGGSVRSLLVSGANLFAGTENGGVFLSTNNGTSWSVVNTGLTNTDVRALVVSGTNLFAGTYGGGVFLSTNNGRGWTAVNNGLTLPHADVLTVSGTNLFATSLGYSWVFLSTNNGTSWTRVSDVVGEITSFAVSGSNFFAGAILIGGGVYRSTDNGASWTVVNTGLSNQNVVSLSVSQRNLFAGTWGSGVFLSTNNGTSWSAANSGLPLNASVWSFAFSGRSVFASTDSDGVFLSTNNGTDWTAVNTGLAGTIVATLVVSDTYLFAGTYGGGVWRRPLSEMITSVQQNNDGGAPRVFALEQNYPNPFNPSTRISYQLPAQSHVTLKVFDVLGREVKALVNEEMKAGSYETTFDASGLASGLYFYRLQAGEFVSTKRLLLMR